MCSLLLGVSEPTPPHLHCCVSLQWLRVPSLLISSTEAPFLSSQGSVHHFSHWLGLRDSVSIYLCIAPGAASAFAGVSGTVSISLHRCSSGFLSF